MREKSLSWLSNLAGDEEEAWGVSSMDRGVSGIQADIFALPGKKHCYARRGVLLSTGYGFGFGGESLQSASNSLLSGKRLQRKAIISIDDRGRMYANPFLMTRGIKIRA